LQIEGKKIVENNEDQREEDGEEDGEVNDSVKLWAGFGLAVAVTAMW